MGRTDTALHGNAPDRATGNDAHMRDFRLYIPHDCVAANTQARSKGALELMQRVLTAETGESSQLIIQRFVDKAGV